MEPAGIGVGLVEPVGLVSKCLRILDEVDAGKISGAESRLLALCFEADKCRFLTWLLGVGIVDGRIEDNHNPLLDDDSQRQLVFSILSRMSAIWSAGDVLIAPVNGADLDDGHAFPGGGSAVEKTKVQKLLSPTQPTVASKRAKSAWALGGQAKFITQLEAFGTLVNRLYNLVPPARFGEGFSVPQLASPIVHMAAHDSKITWLFYASCF